MCVTPPPTHTHTKLQDNQICTLKGSLARLKHLTHLDLANNALRDLPKLLGRLEKLRALRELNLQV